MLAKLLNIIGLTLNLVGVILLFRYGMPYRVRTGGNTVTWTTSAVDMSVKHLERRFDLLGWIGLTCIIAGTALQIYAAAASP